MKKFLLMAVLCCFAATMYAQTPTTPDPQQQQVLKQAELNREKQFNENKQSLNDGKKVADQNVKSMEKQQKALKQEQEQAKAAADAAKEQKKAYEE